MNYIIYDQNRVKLGFLQNVSSIQWKVKYYDRGQAEIHAYPTKENLDHLKKYNTIVCVDRMEVLFIKYVELKEKEIIIKGYLDNLDDRINTSTTKINTVEKDLYALINNNKRGLNIETSPLKGITTNITEEKETTFKELSDTFVDICGKSRIGFKVNFRVSDGVNVLEIYNGSVKSNVRFNDKLNNLISQKLINDVKEYKNYAYVYGEEDSKGNRRSVTINRVKSGEPILETYIDARDIQSEYKDSKGKTKKYTNAEYDKLLTDRGNTKLDEIQDGAIKFTFELVKDSISGSFGIDYDIGDVVPVVSNLYGLKAYARIVGATYVEEKGKDLKIKIDVELEGDIE